MLKRLKIAWAAWGHYNDAVSLATLIGVWGTIVTLTGSAVTFLWGAIAGWDPLVIWLTTLAAAAFFSVIFIAYRLSKIPLPPATVPVDSFFDPALLEARRKLMKEQRATRREEFEREERRGPVISPIRDTNVGNAIAYIGFRIWGKTFFDAASSSEVDGNAEYREFLQAAADGDVTVWGCKREEGVYEVIPSEYWHDHDIEWFGLLKDKPYTQAVAGIRKELAGQIYLSPMTCRAQVERKWPAREDGARVKVIERKMTMTDAFHALNKASEYPAFEDALYQALYDGTILAWGRRQISIIDADELGPYQIIEREYWLSGRFEWTTIGPGGPERAEREGELDFTRVQLNAEQIRQLAAKLAN